MAHPHRPGHGRYTHTPPPRFNRPNPAPPARGRGGYQTAQNAHTPPPPFTRPNYAPPARGRGGYQQYVGDVATGLAIGAVGAAGIMSGCGVPPFGGYQNLPYTTGVAAALTEGAAEFYYNDFVEGNDPGL